MTVAARLVDGVLEIDGQRRLMVSGDYPYYRDLRANWPDRLSTLRASGLGILTCYVPWRHHERRTANGERRYCFQGEEEGNADLLHFLGLAADRDLWVILKPGPFVKGGLDFGGLPDFLSPARFGREALLDADGNPRTSQAHDLPAPFDADFSADVQAWMEALDTQVVAGRLYPRGPILALQIGNEGFYSDANLDIAAFDYSPSGRRRFRQWRIGLSGRGSGIDGQGHEAPREWVQPASLAALRPYLDWGEWCGRYLESAYDACLGPHLGEVPTLVNLSPPARGAAFRHRPGAQVDAWLSRVRPARLGRHAYGFSSWIGSALEDEESLCHHVLAAKRHRGPNLEENWGFTHHGGSYGNALSGVYHAILTLGAGATGFNVYVACATASWGDHLVPSPEDLAQAGARERSKYERPYCPRAPISETGDTGHTFEALRLLTGYLRREEAWILGCSASAGIAWGIYTPYANLAAWQPEPSDLIGEGRLPVGSDLALGAFVRLCVQHHVPFDLLDLEAADLADLAARRVVVLAGAIFLAARVQRLLVDFVAGGGTLILLRERPIFDEHLEPCHVLRDSLFPHDVLGSEQSVELEGVAAVARCRPLARPPDADPLLTSAAGLHGYERPVGEGRAIYLEPHVGELDRWLAGRFVEPGSGPVDAASRRDFVTFERRNPSTGEGTLFVLSRSDRKSRLRYKVHGQPLELAVGPRGCGLLCLGREGLRSAFFKGINEWAGKAVAFDLSFGGRRWTSEAPADVAVWRAPAGDEEWAVVPWGDEDG